MEIKEIYSGIKKKIEDRLAEFKNNWREGDDRYAFTELSFCLFTPQSKAKMCWDAILSLKDNGYIFNGTKEEIVTSMFGVRFKLKKSLFLTLARDKFMVKGFSLKDKIDSFKSNFDRREWLVENVKGLGYKEASHFLRNIGYGDDIAILDRHILKNLVISNIIDEIPKSITKKRYLDMEQKMTIFSKKHKIPMDHLDFVLWYKEAGDVFK